MNIRILQALLQNQMQGGVQRPQMGGFPAQQVRPMQTGFPPQLQRPTSTGFPMQNIRPTSTAFPAQQVRPQQEGFPLDWAMMMERAKPVAESKRGDLKQRISNIIDKGVFKETVSQSIQNDGQKVIDAIDKGDIDTISKIQDKYARDKGIDQGGGGAGPGKVIKPRSGAVAVWNASQIAMEKLSTSTSSKVGIKGIKNVEGKTPWSKEQIRALEHQKDIEKQGRTKSHYKR